MSEEKPTIVQINDAVVTDESAMQNIGGLRPETIVPKDGDVTLETKKEP